MRVKVEQELDHLVTEGILEPVQFADWAALIVPVLKSDGQSVRICGDFRLTINQASRLDRYPIPRIEDLFTCLSGGKSLYEIGPQAGIPTSATDKEVAEVCGGKYPSWPLSLQPAPIWSVLSTRSILARDGWTLEGHSWCHCVH